MQLPQINLNGTGGVQLMEQYLLARKAVQDAIEAVAEAAPHGRDYQTLPPGSAHKAMEEHVDRMNRLRSVHNELEAIAEHLANNGAFSG